MLVYSQTLCQEIIRKMFKAKLCSLIIALLIIQNVSAKPLDDAETITTTATPQELTELEKFIKESSDAIAEKYRQMFKEEIVANATFPELGDFQITLYFGVLVHDETRSIGKHKDLVENFVHMMKQFMNMPAEHVTPGWKAIEDLLVKYECRQLALDIEKRIEELKSEEKRKEIEELNVNGEKKIRWVN